MISSLHPKDVRETVISLAKTRTAKVMGKTCDVRKPDQVRRKDALIHFCVKELGRIDILINNAGIGIFETVEEFDLEKWRAVIDTNLDGVPQGQDSMVATLRFRR